jgi:hypothetical protein
MTAMTSKIANIEPDEGALDPHRPRTERHVVQVSLSPVDFAALTRAAEAAGVARPTIIRAGLRRAGLLPRPEAG